ncbi:MAG TPA: hypothetical protein PKA63_07960 [Oligoflexia bacterium]|nr:hypothetical protein [Oligoflexia bacterium]HMP48584.1 hypothetical protein [Oligoflexia bacterium]
MKKYLTNFIVVLLLLFCTGACSFVNKSIWSKKSDTSGNNNEDSGSSAGTSYSDSDASSINDFPPEDSVLEIVWVVPNDSVDRYRLNYGFDKNNLNNKVDISISQLTKVTHPKYGEVYKYLLTGIPAKKYIYYTLQAGNSHGFSEPTPVNEERAK